jgi:hypothetical protein
LAISSCQFSWGTSTDPDGDPVTYKIEIRYNKTSWSTLIDNYGSTNYTVTLPLIGPYNWRVTASDGSLSSTSSEGTFYFVPADFFVIRDISYRMVQVIENSLFTAIYNTLSTEKKTRFANTYRDITTETGYHVFADRMKYSSVLSPYDSSYAGNNFSYNIWHTHKTGNNKWLDWKYEGSGNGYTGLGGGGGCGLADGEMGNIVIFLNNVPSPPAMVFTYDWACPSSGSKSISWNQEIWTSGRNNAIMRIKWTAATGSHTWYKGWHRGAGDSGWKHDGEWTGGGDRKLDKVWLRMYKYDPN